MKKGTGTIIADWQLPTGVSRSLWDSLHDAETARIYDAQLAGTPLLRLDLAFVLQHCQPPGRFLDLGCGTGRLALTLAQHGHRPLAVDLSPEMLQVLGMKAAEAGIEIPRLCANLVDLDCLADASFDHAACLFSTLGLIVGLEPRRQALRHFYRLLKPGGKFVLHVHNRWFHLWTAGGRRLLLRDVIRSCLGRQAPGDYEMPPHAGFGSLTMHLFSRSETTRLLTQAGFQVQRLQPISLRPDGVLAWPSWFPGLRSYGFMVLAKKPDSERRRD